MVLKYTLLKLCALLSIVLKQSKYSCRCANLMYENSVMTLCCRIIQSIWCTFPHIQRLVLCGPGLKSKRPQAFEPGPEDAVESGTPDVVSCGSWAEDPLFMFHFSSPPFPASFTRRTPRYTWSAVLSTRGNISRRLRHTPIRVLNAITSLQVSLRLVYGCICLIITH